MKIIHSILRYRIFEIIGVLCLIVSLSLIGLILFKDEGLEDLNSQIELKTSDSNANKITNNTNTTIHTTLAFVRWGARRYLLTTTRYSVNT